MGIVTGTIEAVTDKYGKKNMLVNGKWYSTKPEWLKTELSKGMNVEFDDGGKNYIQKLKVAGGGSTASTPNEPTSNTPKKEYYKSTFPIDVRDGQRSIIRQNALTNARELVAASYGASEYAAEDVVDTVVKIARMFEAYTAGDIEREAAALDAIKNAVAMSELTKPE